MYQMYINTVRVNTVHSSMMMGNVCTKQERAATKPSRAKTISSRETTISS